MLRIVSGEYLTVMRSGDVMIYTDSDTVPGAGFLKLTKTYWYSQFSIVKLIDRFKRRYLLAESLREYRLHSY